MGRVVAQRKPRTRKSFRRRTRQLPVNGEASNSLAGWNAASARCVGSSHVANNKPCQDWATTRCFDDGAYVIALSDGAGSSRFSEYGSSLAVERAAALVAEHFDEAFGGGIQQAAFKRKLISQLRLDIYQLASLGIDFPDDVRLSFDLPSREEQLLVPCRPRDLSCTLLVAAVKGNRYFVLHIGDGVVGVESAGPSGNKLAVLSYPDNGEFANETVFLTSGNAVEHARIFTGALRVGTRRITGFVLMSDGPEAALLDKRRRLLAPACGKLLAACRQLETARMHLGLEDALRRVISRKTSDDCSIALLACIR